MLPFVGMARFELATSSSRTKHATWLRYIPSNFRECKIIKSFENGGNFLAKVCSCFLYWLLLFQSLFFSFFMYTGVFILIPGFEEICFQINFITPFIQKINFLIQ